MVSCQQMLSHARTVTVRDVDKSFQDSVQREFPCPSRATAQPHSLNHLLSQWTFFPLFSATRASPLPLPKHNTWAKCSYCSCRRVALTATQDNGGRIKDTVQPPGKGTATPTASSIAAVLQWAKAACSILYLKSILEWLYTSCQRSLKCRSEQCVDAKGYRYNTYSTTQFLE